MSLNNQDWTKVKKKHHKTLSNHQKPPRHGRRLEPIPDFASSEEEAKFTTLKSEITHLMMPGHIRRIAQRINIDDLDKKMLSDEWIEYQRSGWEYVRVVKPNDIGDIPDDNTHDILPLDNGWGDVVLFRRVRQEER